jgi:hypothetical protein
VAGNWQLRNVRIDLMSSKFAFLPVIVCFQNSLNLVATKFKDVCKVERPLTAKQSMGKLEPRYGDCFCGSWDERKRDSNVINILKPKTYFMYRQL